MHAIYQHFSELIEQAVIQLCPNLFLNFPAAAELQVSIPGFFDLLDYAESDQFASRMDALQDGLVDIVDRTRESVAHPWVDLLQSLGTND